MKRIAFVTLFVLVVAVVVVLSDWGAGANTGKNGRANRLAARKGEYGGERVLSKAREAYLERVVTGQEGLSSDTQLEERTLPLAVRVVGYVFFLAVVFAAAMAVGEGIVVGMEYLLGWPDTWWL
jgi:type III secretory pathway component EscS